MLSSSKNVNRRAGRQLAAPVAAGSVIHRGALVVLENGLAKPGHEAVGLTAIGIAEKPADNSGKADGETSVLVERDDWFFLVIDDADPITRVQINQPCFIVDDETVAATDGGGTRSKAGTVRDVQDGGVWIEF
ncbi:conserved hypothetical protein [Roseibium sp. TrichSKD4]|uniref:hypothetical protein n=1 Tax=Roseibium sp. TrichSKD4 TaxID=744980 RepID=UPI0001E57606|nr:hypothetical protein [Roseibium sp. TrichSKD4]EFO30941.1 conserved hypothetical protein [Roseibium sp. TrichSKD4]